MALYATSFPWPSDVNFYPLRDSYTEDMEENVVEFKPEVGPEKRRQRMSTSFDLSKFNLRLSAAEWASLKIFARTTLKSRTLPFTAVNPLTLTTDTFFFMAMPKISAVRAVSYIVAISLRKVADEILIVDGDGATIDLGDGTLMRAF